jgi:excisionase family DNA binding protein
MRLASIPTLAPSRKHRKSTEMHTPRKRLEQLLTVAETAKTLNCSERTVHRTIARGELRAIKINGLVRIVPADLEDFIRDHRSQ